MTACLVVAASTACASDTTSSSTTTTVSAGPSSSSPTGSTSPHTTVPSTSAAPPTTPSSATTSGPTVTAATTTTGRPVCTDITGVEPVAVNFPMTMSSLVGRDIRTGAHDCFERVVIELGGSGAMPGYRIAYVDDPVRLSPSDLVVSIAGAATLTVAAGSWMTTMEGDGYQGPQQLFPTNVRHIEELRLIENFEGRFTWAVGLDTERPFRVSTLTNPPRIVIDIAA